MNKKFIWLIISCLMVVALVLASCAPAVVEEKKATVVTKEPEKKAEEVEEVEEVVGPQYGGILTIHTDTALEGWDIQDTLSNIFAFMSMSHDCLLTPDWWIDRSLITYSTHMEYTMEENEFSWVGALAESWERPNDTTLIFHIRKGILWQNSAPVNGREFVAKDVEAHFRRVLSFPALVEHELVRYIDSVEATDKYTVVFKMNSPWVSALKWIGIDRVSNIVAPEVVEKYGDVRDWRVHKGTGTGPFILEDYVIGSSYTWSRNSTHWMKDPDGNPIPYVDGVRLLVLTELATQIAAMRTGVLDFYGPHGLPFDMRASLEKSNPKLQWTKTPDAGAMTIWPNSTMKPFDDVRVRQALSMGLDRQAINDTIFAGTSTTFSWPARHTWPKDIFVPLDELPENIRELYTYNPEKAKQLLADAGYPTGLKFPMEYWAAGERTATNTATAEMIKAYWAKIGVDVSLSVSGDWAGFKARIQKGEYPISGHWYGQFAPLTCIGTMFYTGVPMNLGFISDPIIDEAYDQALTELDVTKRNKILRELYLHIAEQMYGITIPTQNNWSCWQPWLKGYQGESIFGLIGGATRYVWLDQDLRKQMTGR